MMNYETVLTWLVSLSAVMTAVMGVLLALRYKVSSEKQQFQEIREYFETRTETVDRQTAALLEELKVLDAAHANPSLLDADLQRRVTSLLEEISQELKVSIGKKKEFEKSIARDEAAKAAYDKNLEASSRALDSIEKLSESMTSLFKLVQERRKADG